MPQNIKLSQAMNARLCHDLATSIGAIDNSLGLMDHSNKTIGTKAKNLALEESNHLVNKIKFYRRVYGVTDNETDVSLVGMSKLLADFFKGTKVELNLYLEGGIIYMEAQLSKAISCLASIVSENIGHVGILNIHLTKNESNPAKISGSSDRLMLKEKHLEVLGGNSDEPVSIANCREYYICNICAASGYQITFKNQENQTIEYNLLKIE